MTPPVKLATAAGAAPAASSLESRIQSTFSDSAIFGDQWPLYRDPINRANYVSLSSTILYLKDYLSGKGSYELFRSRLKVWSSTTAYSDPVNQKARANLIALLQGIKDPELKDKVQTALTAILANTKEVKSSAASTPSASSSGVQPSPAAAPSPSAAPKNVVSFDFKKAQGAKEERDRLLSDAALGWSEDHRKKYPQASLGLIRVRDFVAGRSYDADALRSAVLAWRRDPSFKSDPVLKNVYASTISALKSAKTEANIKPAAAAATIMAEVDASVAGLEKKTPEPPSSPKAEKPATPQPSKKPEPPKKPATPPASAPAPKPVTPPPPSTPSAKASALLTDEAIFSDKLGEWNAPAVKGGSHLALNSSILTLREFMDGKADYTTLKDRLDKWQGSASYKDPLSYRARTNMIALLEKMKQGDFAWRATTALGALKLTAEIPAPPAPAPKAEPSPVAFAMIDVIPDAKADGAKEVTEEAFRAQRLEIAKREHATSMTKTGKIYNFSAEVYVAIKPETGEVSKVTFKNVSAVRANESAPDPTAAEVNQFMKALVNAYRAETKFPKKGKAALGFKLDLKGGGEAIASAGSKTVSPPPSPTLSAPVSPPPPPVKAEGTKSAGIKSTYTFDLGSQPAPGISGPQSGEGISAAFRSAAQQAANSYGKKIGGFRMKTAVKINLDSSGFVKKVEFTDVGAQSGIGNGAQMEDFLSLLARKFRGSIRGEANSKVDAPKVNLGAD
jgi:hypothetical protein